MVDVSRVESIEERTRKVEDAIIRFEYIADTILVKQENRIQALEKHDEELQSVLYNTCDVKSKEIDEKVGNASKALQDIHDKSVGIGISLVAGLFFMFVGYVAYDQGQKATINDTLSSRAVASQENKTHIEVIQQGINKMDDKLDRIFDNQSVLINHVEKEK